MPRMPGVVVPGLPLHVIQRGNNRQAIFFTDQDYYRFHTHLRAAAERSDCVIHAYIYMTNHVHLLVTPNTRQGISSMMQSVGRRYVRYINDLYNRSGTLWEGRYKSALVDSDRYLLVCSRYIEMNPVRARIRHAIEGSQSAKPGFHLVWRSDARRYRRGHFHLGRL